jgi:uncharacterized protein
MRIGVIAAVVASLAIESAAAGRQDGYLGPLPLADTKIRYLTFQSTDHGHPIAVAGRLQMPVTGKSAIPAVVIMHGTDGVSARGVYYATALNRAGIATFEIDQWGARNLAGGADGRPNSVPETLPDAFGALGLLASTPGIDPKRIGIMGFSWGGVVAMLVSTQRYQDEFGAAGPGYAAAMPFYPVCWGYNHVPGYEFKGLRPIPIRIVAAGADEYDEGVQPCRDLISSLPREEQNRLSLKIYANAPHAFDGFGASHAHSDPFGHRGKGGIVHMANDPAAREDARAQAVAFFTKALQP